MKIILTSRQFKLPKVTEEKEDMDTLFKKIGNACKISQPQKWTREEYDLVQVIINSERIKYCKATDHGYTLVATIDDLTFYVEECIGEIYKRMQ